MSLESSESGDLGNAVLVSVQHWPLWSWVQCAQVHGACTILYSLQAPLSEVAAERDDDRMPLSPARLGGSGLGGEGGDREDARCLAATGPNEPLTCKAAGSGEAKGVESVDLTKVAADVDRVREEEGLDDLESMTGGPRLRRMEGHTFLRRMWWLGWCVSSPRGGSCVGSLPAIAWFVRLRGRGSGLWGLRRGWGHHRQSEVVC
jgi:hypothetical protein